MSWHTIKLLKHRLGKQSKLDLGVFFKVEVNVYTLLLLAFLLSTTVRIEQVMNENKNCLSDGDFSVQTKISREFLSLIVAWLDFLT